MEDKSRDILKKKAEESPSLKESMDEDFSDEEIYHKEINSEGKEILVFEDPLHSREKRSMVNYSVFRGKWEFENIDEIDGEDEGSCAVRFTPVKDGSNVSIAFKSLKDRLEFMDSIYSDNEMRQVGTGMDLEKIANSNVLKTTGGIVGLGLAGFALYKLFGGKKNEEEEKL